jgi:protein ImuA
MARLRRVIAQIEAEAGPAGERPARRLPFARAFDSALGGGLADDALHEIAPARSQDGAAAMGFALALAARFLSNRPRRSSSAKASPLTSQARFMGRASSLTALP